MTNEQLAKIKEAAEKATHRWNETDVFLGGNPHVIERQFDFVKACDPVSVLSLIARLEAAEARATTAYNEGIEAAAKVHINEIPKIEKQIEANNEYKKRTGDYDDTANELCRVAIYHHNWVFNAIRALLKDKPHG